MPEVAVADTGPLRHLAEIRRPDLLGALGECYIPAQVAVELEAAGFLDTVDGALGRRLRVEQVAESSIEAGARESAGFRLQRPDLAVLVLAEAHPDAVVLTDDLQLRRAVEARGRPATGSIGIVVRAFHRGQISYEELCGLVDLLLDGSSLYASRGLRATVRRLLMDLCPGADHQ